MLLNPTAQGGHQPQVKSYRPRKEGDGTSSSRESFRRLILPRSTVIFREDLIGDGEFLGDAGGDKETGEYSPLQRI